MSNQSDRSKYETYSFGDNDLAAERLGQLAELFEPSMLALLRRHAPERPEHALDFGCGPGFTTRTLWSALSPRALTGLDNSASFLERARRSSPEQIAYVLHDVTLPFAAPPAADLAYARFLLTHLSQPAAVLAAWATALAPGARLLIQETAGLASPHPVLGRYYELVEEFQRRRGQRLNVGRELTALVDPELYQVIDYVARPLELSSRRMARLHAMNLRTWRHDALAQHFDRAELLELASALERLSQEATSDVSVEYVLGELVLERRR